jgi:cell division protein FtsZ
MIEYNNSQNSALPGGDVSFKVIGVGGSGANVLDRLALEGSDDAQLLVLNTDIRKLSSSVSSQKIQLGATLLKGMGTGGDPDLGKQAANEAADEIRESIKGYNMVFVCVGLGGGTGSGAAPEVCRIAREEGVFLVVFTTLPFQFEGTRRMEQARYALNEIESYANAVITFENDRMGELIVPKDGVTQAFAAADKIISQSIRATMNIVSKPGIIRIGMDDLLTALSSKNSRCLFGYGQAKGENRANDAVEQTLKCPLLDNGKLLNEAQNVLVQVSGSDSMTLLEVQTVMKEVTRHLKPNAHVLFGTGTDSRLGSSLAVTIISSLAGEERVKAAPRFQKRVESSIMESIAPSPLAAAITAATVAAQEVSGARREVSKEVPAYSTNIVPMEQPRAAQVDAPKPVAPRVEPMVEVPRAPLETPAFMMTNPIASAIQEATLHAQGFQPSGLITPRPLAPPPEPHHDAPVRVEAKTDQAQTIALSRIVPGQPTQRILSRPAKEDLATRQPSPAAANPELEQTQDILQLEPVQSKGRFAKGDPTIVDGEDLDVPTFLRKKG